MPPTPVTPPAQAAPELRSDVHTQPAAAAPTAAGEHPDTASAPTAPTKWPWAPRRTVALGFIGSVLLAVGAVGAGGVLVRDPVLAGSVFSWIRYGHGRDLATAVVYGGFFMVLWAWVRLGRDVLAERVDVRGVLAAAAAWMLPLLFAPPLFTRDVYSYLAQGGLAANGHDPYEVGPEVMNGAVAENVHFFWQDTPAPYGPLFILIAKTTFLVTGNGVLTGVLAMRLVILTGLVLVLWALPGLVRHLGGRLPVALWLMVASPMTVVHLVGGPHNDLIMIGLLAAGVLLVLDGRHGFGIALVTLAMAIKATAGLALPFMVWIWAARLPGGVKARFAKAVGVSVGIFLVVFAAVSLAAGTNMGWVQAMTTPSAIVNYLSIPTGVGEVVHGLVSLVVTVDRIPIITVTRGLGLAVLFAILVRQWWLARDGNGPETVRRATVVLFFAVVLAPAVLPWYYTWALVLAAALPLRRSVLVGMVGFSVFLVMTAYPTGEQSAMYEPLYMLGVFAVMVLAAVSLVRPDPLRLFGGRPDDRDGHRDEPANAATTT